MPNATWQQFLSGAFVEYFSLAKQKTRVKNSPARNVCRRYAIIFGQNNGMDGEYYSAQPSTITTSNSAPPILSIFAS
jgi:hypothetical protein